MNLESNLPASFEAPRDASVDPRGAVAGSTTSARAADLLAEHRRLVYVENDRFMGRLLLGEWLAGIVVALVVSPYTWAGRSFSTHFHVYMAVLFGGAIISLPVALSIVRPGHRATRHVIACAQMLWSALLVHLTGGRIETHFHVFGSLAVLSFYRDWRVLLTASVTVATEHFFRGILWPESIYGIANPEWWRFLEHAFWVVFCSSLLTMAGLRGVTEMRRISERQAETESLSRRERENAQALNLAMDRLANSQQQLVRTEKLAAVGQLAASVGHELRNPLAAMRNAVTYLDKRLRGIASPDPRINQFLDIVQREIDVSSRIISDLLDFSRERPPHRSPVPLRSLVAEAMSVVPSRKNVELINDVPDDLPVPAIDKEQMRQVFINLVQNAGEAIPSEREGHVTVTARGGGSTPWKIAVTDDGTGMPEDVAEKIFQPLYTTKSRGTGLGLAIVHGMIERHGGSIRVRSEVGRGTVFEIELPTDDVVDATPPRSSARRLATDSTGSSESNSR